MALINCPECGKEISDTCKTCLYCGYNVKKFLKGNKRNQKNNVEEVFSEFKVKIKYLLLIMGIILGVVLGIFYINNSMPNLVGLTREDAVKILNEKGYNYRIKEEFSYEYSKGIVIEQSKSEGELCFEKNEIQVVVSSGKKIKIPVLVGEKYEEVKEFLNGVNVQLKYGGSTTVEKGIIISASKNNEEVLEEDTIVVFVSEGIFKPVPSDVIGKSKEEAIKQLEELGLRVECKEELTSTDVQVGMVYAYSPLDYVNEGDCISLSVSSGHGVNVKDYLGKTVNSTIRNELDSLNIEYRMVEKYYDMEVDGSEDIEGKIIEQKIKGMVVEGTEIEFVISKPAISISQVDWDIDYAGGVDTYITFKNNTDKEIAYVTFEMQYFDRMGNVAECEIRNTSKRNLLFTGPLRGGETASREYWQAPLYNTTVAALRPNSAIVEFTDGTKQKLTYNGRYWYGTTYYGGDLND